MKKLMILTLAALLSGCAGTTYYGHYKDLTYGETGRMELTLNKSILGVTPGRLKLDSRNLAELRDTKIEGTWYDDVFVFGDVQSNVKSKLLFGLAPAPSTGSKWRGTKTNGTIKGTFTILHDGHHGFWEVSDRR